MNRNVNARQHWSQFKRSILCVASLSNGAVAVWDGQSQPSRRHPQQHPRTLRVIYVLIKSTTAAFAATYVIA